MVGQMEKITNTILVEPRTLFREALASVLSTTKYGTVRSFASITEMPKDLLAEPRELLFIVSSECQNLENGIFFGEAQALRLQYPHSRLVLLSESFQIRYVVCALQAGANGYILSTITSDVLVKSLDLTLLGATVLPAEFPRAMLHDMNWSLASQASSTLDSANGVEHLPRRQDRLTDAPKLSTKETEILAGLIVGACNKDIARHSGMAEATVKTHIKAILRKINVNNRTQAAVWALKHMPNAKRQITAT